MTIDAMHSELHRNKIGAAFLLVGVVLILWAWGSWTYRTWSAAPAAAVAPAEERPPDASRGAMVRTLPSFLIVVVVLVLIVLVGSFLLARWGRRLRDSRLQRATVSTPSEDVWHMHRLPHVEPKEAGPAGDDDDA